MVAGILVFVLVIVFGVGEMETGSGGVEVADLIVKGHGLVTLFGVAGDGDTADGEFQSELRFDGSGDNGVVTEDLFPCGRGSGDCGGRRCEPLCREEAGAAEEKGVGGFEESDETAMCCTLEFGKFRVKPKGASRL